MRHLLPLLFVISNLVLGACGVPVTFCPDCPAPTPTPAATDDDDSTDSDTTPEPTPALECDPEILDDIVEEIECPTGTFPANVSVTCEDGNWEVQLNCPPFPPEAVENDCDANLNAATLSCLAGGGSLDTFECSSKEYTFSCEHPEADPDPEMSCDELAALATATCSPATVVELNCSLLQFACDTDDDGSGDINIQITVNQDGDVTVTTSDDDTVGDDDDTTTSGDDDDDDTTTGTDDLGSMSCCVDVDSDNSCDVDHGDTFAASFEETESGYNDYTSGLWSSYNALGPICVEYADGTDDDQDNDGDSYTEDAGDCNDGNDEIRPGATETCDGYDNDCDSAVDEGASDADGDGYFHPGCHSGGTDCRDGDEDSHPGATETCADAIDANCTGYTDDLDVDGDGYVGTSCTDFPSTLLAGDCQDTLSVVGVALTGGYFYPGASEYPDWEDNDCDGTDDETCDWSCAGANDTNDDDVLECSDDWNWWYGYEADTDFMVVCTP